MTLFKIVIVSTPWLSPTYCNAPNQADFEIHKTLYDDNMVLLIMMTFLPQYCILRSDS